MTEIIIQNIDPNALRQLEALAKRHGRSLQAEIKHILEAIAQDQLALPTQESEIVYQKALQMQKQLENYPAGQPSSEMSSTHSSLNLVNAMERLKTLKQTITSLQGLSIREVIEEGRRF